MHKGIRLTLQLWIESEDESAQNSASYAKAAIEQMLDAGRPLHPDLRVEIRSLEEDTDWEEINIYQDD